jgi:hypothetical protein
VGSGIDLGFFIQAITAAGTRKNESTFGDLHTQIKNNKLTVDVKANSESDVSMFHFPLSN